jgi:hypothetical protein
MSNFNQIKYDYAMYYPYIGLRVRGKLTPIGIFKEYWYGRRVDRMYKPTNPRTYEQQNVRQLLFWGYQKWHTFDAQTKLYYNKLRPKDKLYGFHQWIRLFYKANKGMIYYWGPSQKDPSDPATPDAYMSSDRFQGVQKLRALSEYPSGFPYGAIFYHSTLDKILGRLIPGWVDLGAQPPTPTGYSINLVAASLSSTTDGATYYFGSLSGLAPQTTANLARVYIPKAGTIKVAYVVARAATIGTNEAWSAYIRVNNTTDYLIQTLSSTDNPRVWSNTSLSIAVSQGDYFEIKMVCPTWATNPATVAFGGVVYIE